MKGRLLVIITSFFVFFGVAQITTAKDIKLNAEKYKDSPNIKFSFELMDDAVMEGMPVGVRLTLQNLSKQKVFLKRVRNNGLIRCEQIEPKGTDIPLTNIAEYRIWPIGGIEGIFDIYLISVEMEPGEIRQFDLFISMYYKNFKANKYKIKVHMPIEIDYPVMEFKRQPFGMLLTSEEMDLVIEKPDPDTIAETINALKFMEKSYKFKMSLLTYTTPEIIPVICDFEWSRGMFDLDIEFGLLSFNDPRTDLAFIKSIDHPSDVPGILYNCMFNMRSPAQLAALLPELNDPGVPQFAFAKEEIELLLEKHIWGEGRTVGPVNDWY